MRRYERTRAAWRIARLQIVGRLATAIGVAAVAVGVPVALIAPAAASATVSGDYCTNAHLGPAGTCYHAVQHNFIETESWSSAGHASCTGISESHYWYADACVGDGAPGTTAYCYLACDGQTAGEAFVHDHSADYSDYYTGWLYANW